MCFLLELPVAYKDSSCLFEKGAPSSGSHSPAPGPKAGGQIADQISAPAQPSFGCLFGMTWTAIYGALFLPSFQELGRMVDRQQPGHYIIIYI